MFVFRGKGRKILLYVKYVIICKIFLCLGRVYFRKTFFLKTYSGLVLIFPSESSLVNCCHLGTQGQALHKG